MQIKNQSLFTPINVFKILTVFALAATSFAEELDKNSLSETQGFLKDRSKVETVLSADPKARKADDFAKQVGGSDENVQQMYSIAADILPVLLEMNENNPEKALNSLQEYSKNPKEFLARLPAGTRKKIENLASKIESEKPKKP